MAKKRVRRTEAQKQRRANALQKSREYRSSNNPKLGEEMFFGGVFTRSEGRRRYNQGGGFGSIALVEKERKARRKSAKTGNSYFYDLFKDTFGFQ